MLIYFLQFSVLKMLMKNSRILTKMSRLLDYFPLFPSKVLAAAFSAFICCRSVSGSAFSAYFNVESTLLSEGFFEGVHNGHCFNLPQLQAMKDI
jgi:hypothetical protein